MLDSKTRVRKESKDWTARLKYLAFVRDWQRNQGLHKAARFTAKRVKEIQEGLRNLDHVA